MSDTASVETAPVAATPTPPAAPVTPTPAPAATPPPDTKKLAGDLYKLLTTPTEDLVETANKKPAEPAAPTDGKKPAETQPVVAEKPIKVRKPKVPEETAPPIPKKSDLAPAPVATTPVAPVKPAAEDDTTFEKDLVDEERALLDDARAAEKYLGDKYKGQGAKMTAFLKEVAKKTGEPDFDESDPAFQKWYQQNLPKIGALDFRQIERARVKEDVTKEFEPKLEAERHSRWAEAEAPKVKAKGDAIFNKLIQSSIPDEMAKAIAERTKGITDRAEYIKAIQAVEKDYSLEKEITENIVNAATSDLEEFHRLTTINSNTGKALVDFNPSNQQHERILKIVSDLCSDFKANGGADLKRDGKWFVTREEWTSMAPEQRGPFWTFSNEQLIERASGNVKAAVNQAVKMQQQALEARGFRRTIAPSAPAPTTPNPVPSGAPPAPRPTPPPATGNAGQPTLAQSLARQLSSTGQEN